MKKPIVLFRMLVLLLIVCSCKRLAAPSHPSAPVTSNICSLPAEWFGDTKEPMFRDIPPSHAVNPSDCPFYVPAWQEFLFATKPLKDTYQPAFLSYPTFLEIFETPNGRFSAERHKGEMVLELEPRDLQRANRPTPDHQRLIEEATKANSDVPPNNDLDDTLQAAHGRGVGGALIDQNGHFVFYAIHANQEMVNFLKLNHLTSPDVRDHVQAAPPFVPLTPPISPTPSLVEYKSAWTIVDSPSSAPNYYVVRAAVPRFVLDTDGKVSPEQKDGQPVRQQVWVALLAIHVVFTLPGHPEMIWSTFEHVGFHDGSWQRDNAPAAESRPSDAPPVIHDSGHDYRLYKAKTPCIVTGDTATECNKIPTPAQLAAHWDADKQAFVKGGVLQTSVYRSYPNSKVEGDQSEDGDIVSVNNNATTRFADNTIPHLEGDKRQFYRLVGAVWFDKPARLQVGVPIQNSPNQTPDDPDATVAGEDGLGSTAMESFTEDVAPNCFSCHDAQAVIVPKHPSMPPSLANLSHLMSKYAGILPSPSTPSISKSSK